MSAQPPALPSQIPPPIRKKTAPIWVFVLLGLGLIVGAPMALALITAILFGISAFQDGADRARRCMESANISKELTKSGIPTEPIREGQPAAVNGQASAPTRFADDGEHVQMRTAVKITDEAAFVATITRLREETEARNGKVWPWIIETPKKLYQFPEPSMPKGDQ